MVLEKLKYMLLGKQLGIKSANSIKGDRDISCQNRHVKAAKPSHSLSGNMFGNNSLSGNNSGFTLLELLVTITMIGVLMAIAAPSWLSFTNRQRMRSDQGEIYQAIKRAQSIAKRDKRNTQVTFRTDTSAVPDQVTGFFVHSFPQEPTVAQWTALSGNTAWEDLNNRSLLVSSDLFQDGTTGFYAIQFDSRGILVREGQAGTLGQLGRITLALRQPDGSPAPVRGCIFVDTLLGGLRSGENTECPYP